MINNKTLYESLVLDLYEIIENDKVIGTYLWLNQAEFARQPGQLLRIQSYSNIEAKKQTINIYGNQVDMTFSYGERGGVRKFPRNVRYLTRYRNKIYGIIKYKGNDYIVSSRGGNWEIIHKDDLPLKIKENYNLN